MPFTERATPTWDTLTSPSSTFLTGRSDRHEYANVPLPIVQSVLYSPKTEEGGQPRL
jgi:hypothetical protein